MRGSSKQAFLEVDHIEKSYGAMKAVDRVSFSLAKGEFLTLLGPSGCGKTTSLRAIAGFETITAGRISIDGEPVSDPANNVHLPPERRQFGMVFQSYAVWPHMSVAENVAYGLHNLKLSRAERDQRIRRVLAKVGLEAQLERPATMLSGGQQQRVALARAIVYEPKVLLFDEPLSNLDAKLREAMRLELRRLQAELGITSLYVTHDQEEAMVVSDRVIVMSGGHIQQIGSPSEIYDRPANRFVADFIGSSNLLSAKVSRYQDARAVVETNELAGAEILCDAPTPLQPGSTVTLSFRPEHATLSVEPVGKGRNALSGHVSGRINMGSHLDYRIAIGTAEIRVTAPRSVEIPLSQKVDVVLDSQRILALAS
ncbi:ABC-type Fe3+/spermidine/putrescine transport system ATPase subunit [Rhizobium sp. BK313]|uniref:ABC transporter ATP-binding protein n=1 Tax=Rhizobium sp. BK313 TaxID=2587081 RepID=UPI00105EA284|nr:ABC transporter ATP-binding protein [Rhizobium sp. BK313]MBB3458954.1 ABC-type Fe3+/spermidine/putrescine transport system ATPase subunit [Rhizobium sp. BK313]